MNIIYFLQGSKETKKVKVRFYHNRLDLTTSTSLLCKTENWDPVSQLFVNDNTTRRKWNVKLNLLKDNIETEFNTDFLNGEIMDTKWLENIVKKTFLRPNMEEKLHNDRTTVYLYDFGVDWLENKSADYRSKKSKPLTKKRIGQLTKALSFFAEYQGTRHIKLKDFSLEEIEKFFHFLIDQKYSFSSAKKRLTELRFLCARAKKMNLNINPDYLQKIDVEDSSEEIEEIYLNETEIEIIFNKDFSDNDLLDIVRDRFILSLWTGIRVSDLNTLDSNNIINGLLEVVSKKTNTLSKIALHPHVRYTLAKRGGLLPPKVSENEYNIQIKEVCRLCKIDAPTYGKLKDKEKKREIAGYYPKYKLVSSHIARRSFATNLSDKISTKAISKMLGHKSLTTTELYNKKSKLEYSEEASNLWDSKN